MDEKVREIEERLLRAEKFAEQLQIEQDCRYLLSYNKALQDHADKLGEIITGQTLKRLELENRVKELEEENKRLSSEWQQTHDWNNQVITENQNLKTHIKKLGELADIVIKANKDIQCLLSKIKELETALDITAGALEGSQGVVRELKEGIEGILNQKDLISFTIQKQLEELMAGKEKP